MKSEKPRDIFNLDLQDMRPQIEAEARARDLSITQLIRLAIRELIVRKEVKDGN